MMNSIYIGQQIVKMILMSLEVKRLNQARRKTIVVKAVELLIY